MKRVLLLLCAVLCASTLLAAQSAPASAKLKDEIRQPWQPNQGGYLRHWLILGILPNKSNQAVDVDFLTEHGGEANIRPVAGMKHKTPDGREVAWKDFDCPSDSIDLAQYFGANDAVAYAYTTFERAVAGKALLSIGSDDGAIVWLNGTRVHRNIVNRGLSPDEDQVEVNLAAGTNHVLLKINQGNGGWGYIFRVLEAGAATRRVTPLQATVESSDGKSLTVASNASTDSGTVQFAVMAAGGRVLTQKSAPRGEKVSIDTALWPQGAYEVRASTKDSLGKTSYAYAAWYKGDLLAALKDVVAKAPQGQAKTAEAGHLQMLAELVKDRMQGKMDTLEGQPLPVLQSILMEYAELQQQISAAAAKGSGQTATARSASGPVHGSGFVRLAYIDDVDGSTQFCRAYLPARYDSNRKWPLVLNLHGNNGDNPVYVRWWSVDVRHNALADDHDLIFVEPHGRGNTSYQGMGERDVMRCVQLAKERFRIDDDRVYLTGASMGGGGTWYVGSRHPEVFAAIAPVYGGWDYHVTMSDDQLDGGWDYHEGMAEDRISKLTPRQRYDLEAQSSFAQADALLNTPVFVNHGDADMMVPVANSRYAVRMLQRWGYDVRYREHPGKGHASLGNEDEVMEWLLQHKRTLYPQKVRVRAAELSSASAFWVRANQRSDEREFMLAEAKLTAPNTIQLDTKNVVSVTLSPGSPLVAPAKPLKIVWNGAERTATLKDGKVTLLAEGYTTAKLEKTATTAGPMAGAINGPFAVVVGTIAEDEMARKLCESKAKDLAGYWMQTQHQPVRMFKDTEISEADLARYSLVLIGGSEANAVTRKLAGSLPLKISGSDVTIDGRTFHAPDAGVAMVYPHPLNSARYVLLMASTSPSGMYFINPLRFDMNDHDFVIADGVMPDFRRVRTAAQSRIASGWFDTQWRLKPELVEEGDPAIRNGALVVKVRPDLTHYVDGGKQLKTEILDSYVGGYESREAKLKLVREGNTLIVHIPNQPAFSMVATSETEFVLPEANAAVTFVKDAQGKVTHARVEGSGFAFDSKKVN